MNALIKYTFFSCFFLFLSCKRSVNNPCEGLLNESPPLRIGVILIDKQTGKNLLETSQFNTGDIKVTVAGTENVFSNWRIIKNANTPLNGLLEFSVFHEKAGVYAYKIELKDLATVNLSYTIRQEQTGDPCKQYYYPMENLKVLNYDFVPFKYEDKTLPNFVVVTIN